MGNIIQYPILYKANTLVIVKPLQRCSLPTSMVKNIPLTVTSVERLSVRRALTACTIGIARPKPLSIPVDGTVKSAVIFPPSLHSHPLKTIFQHKACTDKLYADSFYKVQKNSYSSFEVICCRR